MAAKSRSGSPIGAIIIAACMRDMASAISVLKGERGAWAKAISTAPARADPAMSAMSFSGEVMRRSSMIA